jgi:glycosyltransferase involved in cell wall biosynthesis
MTRLAVTVVLPSKDRPELLQRSLACALGQTGVDLEVVVIDDGSSPALEGRVSTLADRRITVLRHDRARGVASARNAGIAAARHPFVAFLDDDDVWAPTKLVAQARALDSSDADFSYTGTVWLDEELRPQGAFRPCPAQELRAKLRDANVIGSPSTVVARTRLLREVGGFHEGMSVLADWELWLRLAERSVGIEIDELLYGYVLHGSGMHLQDFPAVRHELDMMRRSHPGEPDIGGLGFWQWFASSQRWAGDRLGAARSHAYIGLRFGRGRDIARGVGLLFGERAMKLGRRSVDVAPPAPPPWLVDLARTHHRRAANATM